ncbi:uncharacterized protein LOC121426824 isoform X2 [Lytechinus variegatus]|uniref:uncharacterized protein LOC121426824 isoform X2 n=1 Tax=Lytechinus variegatus TaxID=7654 RepID=UPI001BB29B44|nr:uncharacterized protein LOC121426824 isoform X2 [Lytechinus variegatus]
MAEKWSKQDEIEFKELRRRFIDSTRRRMKAKEEKLKLEMQRQREERRDLFDRRRNVGNIVTSNDQVPEEPMNVDMPSTSGWQQPSTSVATSRKPSSSDGDGIDAVEEVERIDRPSTSQWEQDSSISDESLLAIDIENEEEPQRRGRSSPTPQNIMDTIEDYYSIDSMEERLAPRFRGRVQDHRVRVHSLDFLLRRMFPEDVVGALLQSVMNRLTVNMEDNDLVGFAISAPHLRQEIGIPLTRRDQMTLERLVTTIEQILQSNDEFLFEGGFEIRVIHIRMPVGGRNKEYTLPLDKFICSNRRFIRIVNDDNLCCARSLVVAIGLCP